MNKAIILQIAGLAPTSYTLGCDEGGGREGAAAELPGGDPKQRDAQLLVRRPAA